LHKSLEAVRQFRRKKVLVLASQGMAEEEGHLLLREVETVRDLLCPRVMVALLHGIVLFDVPALPLFTYVKGNSPFRVRFQRDCISLLVPLGPSEENAEAGHQAKFFFAATVE
jgi:hypothetical protein